MKDSSSVLFSIDPRLKIAYSLVVALLVITLNRPAGLLGLLLFTLIPWPSVRPSKKSVYLFAWVVCAAVFSDMVSQGFFYGLHPRTILMNILPGLSLCKEGIFYGAVQSMRVVCVLSAGLLVVRTTHPSDLVFAFRSLRLPGSLSFVMLIAIRFLPEMVEQARRVLIAQKLRGVKASGVLGAVRSFHLLIVPLIGISLRKARQLALAAEVRAYSSDRIPARKYGFSSADWTTASILLVVLISGLFASFMR